MRDGVVLGVGVAVDDTELVRVMEGVREFEGVGVRVAEGEGGGTVME